MRRGRWSKAGAGALALALAVGLGACSDGGGGSEASTRPTVAGALPATPVEVSVPKSDGAPLKGLYYPAAAPDAPLVVLMHWELADRSDWYVLAPWLQNRGELNTFPIGQQTPLTDPSWYPKIDGDRSYGVFAVSMSGCEAYPYGCPDWTPAQWLDDAKAVMAAAATLDGIDPRRIVTVGSGVGADAAVDACTWWITEQAGTCKGAFALSPGSYLGTTFSDATATLADASPAVPVWCLAATPFELGLCDGAETDAAKAAGSRAIYVQDAGHANAMFSAQASPNVLTELLDFLQTTVG